MSNMLHIRLNLMPSIRTRGCQCVRRQMSPSVPSVPSVSSISIRYFQSSASRKSVVDVTDPDELEIRKYRPIGSYFSRLIDPKYRVGHYPIYEAPNGLLVAVMKKASYYSFFMASCAGSLIVGADIISLPVMCGIMAGLSVPCIMANYLSAPYVNRIFRLYRENEPQTYENLIKEESLVFEKIDWTGKRTYNRIIPVEDIRLANRSLEWCTWEAVDKDTGKKEKLYVVDNMGGIKMDRIWGIIEKNSGVNNGR